MKKINYLHIDTQGSDLKVLKGLNKKINIVEEGILEAAVNKENSLYSTNHTIKDVEKFLTKNNFKISKIEAIDENIKNEKNVYFQKKSLNKKDLNRKYNLRYYNRLISNKLNLKDKVFDNISRIFSFRFY